MKPVLENISLEVFGQSLKIFTIEESYFKSFWHFHPQLELTYIMEGEGMRYVGDSIEVFGPGDLVLLGKNIPHNWESFKHSSPGARALVIQFSEEILLHFPEFKDLKQLVNNARPGLHFQKCKPGLFGLLNKLIDWEESLQLIKFFEVLFELSKEQSTQLSGSGFVLHCLNSRESRINMVKEYISSNVGAPISLEEIAAYMKMTESYFCRWFKKNTGNTFTQYLNKLRVELVCRELVVTDHRISEIAYSKGFESISHFNRVFKTLKEESPGNYRAKNIK